MSHWHSVLPHSLITPHHRQAASPPPAFRRCYICFSSMFGRSDIGALFGAAASDDVSRGPSAPTFVPTGGAARRPTRMRAGAIPDWAAPSAAADAQTLAAPVQAPVEPATAASSAARARVVSAVISAAVGGTHAHAVSATAPAPAPVPAPRARIEAVVISGGSAPALETVGETAEEIAERRRRVRERLAARAAVEGSGGGGVTDGGQDGGVRASALTSSSLTASMPAVGAAQSGMIVLKSSGGVGAGASAGRWASGGATAASAASPSFDDGGSDGSSDSGDDDDDDDDGAAAAARAAITLRPTFRPRAVRTTVVTSDAVAAAEAEAEAAVAAAKARNAEETRALVVDELLREDAATAASAAVNAGDGSGDRNRPDDTDRPEAAEEDLRAWRLRELKRIHRDLDAARAIAEEAAETARRRGLTDKERAMEDAATGSRVFEKTRERRGFLEKYHHRGAFYMDEDSVRAGDVRLRQLDSGPAVDRAALPAPMQVRDGKFGMRGQTKYTHLAAEDTTAKGDILYFSAAKAAPAKDVL